MLIVLLALMALAGCKTVEQTQTQTAQPTQTVQGGGGNNPLTVLLVEQADQKDMALGEMGALLDTYQPKDGETDYSALIQTVLLPFGETDGLLADVLILSFYLQPQPDGTYRYTAQDREASLSMQEQAYTYGGTIRDGGDEDAYQRQSARFDADGSRMNVEVFEKQADSNEIRTFSMQWMHEDGLLYAQCYYTLNGGETYDILRYQIGDDSFAFAIYEAVDQSVDLFTLSPQALFGDGYITYAVYQSGTVTIVNDNQTLVVGP